MATCNFCGKALKFLNKRTCSCCGKIMCSKCLVKVSYDKEINELLCSTDDGYTTPNRKLFGGHYLCKNCSIEYEKKYRTMVDATNDHDDVELVSENYRGNRFNRLNKIKRLQTSYYKFKSEAEEEIKSMAKYLGCTHILELSFDRGEREEEGSKGGTYIYSTWSAIGFAAK